MSVCRVNHILAIGMEINPNEIYTPKETEQMLKISSSTFKRLIKKGLLRANKVGNQHRIFGHEILRMLSPEIDQAATKAYKKMKKTTKDKTKQW